MDAPPPVPPLVVYPSLWRQAVEQHPRGPDYDWRDRWRALTRLAREFRRGPFVHLLALAGRGERALIQSLAECNVEVMALEFAAVFPDADPLQRLDPTGPFVAVQPAPNSTENHSHEHDR
jgi:hypothetical protein